MNTSQALAFWEKDLSEIEDSFLHGKKITSLPVHKMDARVPAQGSVLLDRAVDIDAVISDEAKQIIS